MEIKKFGAYPTTNPPSPSSQTLPFGEIMQLMTPLFQSLKPTASDVESQRSTRDDEVASPPRETTSSQPHDTSSAYAHYLKRHEEIRRRIRKRPR